MPRYYLLGTEQQPHGVIRSNRDDPDRPLFERFNPDTNDWRPAPEMGRYVILGDTMLDDLDADRVDVVLQRLRIRVGPD
jgi:hypothetical protein